MATRVSSLSIRSLELTSTLAPTVRLARRLRGGVVQLLPPSVKQRVRRLVGRGTAAWVLATVCLLCVWFVSYALLLTPIQESHDQAVLYNTLREQLALQTAPLGGSIAPGSAVALMSATSLGVVDDVATWIWLLAQPETAWTTGNVIHVDGGQVLGLPASAGG